MNENLIKAFKKFNFLRVSDLAVLLSLSSFKMYSKGETIAQEGDKFEYVLLIRRGIIRNYLLTPDGAERTVKLSKEKDITTSAASFLYGKASTEYLEAIEETSVIMIDTKKLREASEDNIRILRLINEGLKEAFSETIMRIEFFTTLSPEQRYKKIMEHSPELIQRVPQKFLASYLGITTVSLSRIKTRFSSR
jgi:CRP-like cAMP-binding protein